jgi:general nucleoside transport system permease protein
MQTAGMLNILATTLGADWRLATPLIFAATGEAICERAGVLNIGIEGIMLIGAFFGFATTYATGDLALGFGAGMASGFLAAVVFAVFAVTIRADQIVVGVAINLLGMGLTAFLFRTYFVSTGRGVDIVPSLDIPFLSSIPYLGAAVFQQNTLVYATVPVVIVAWLFLFRTSYGLTVRAVGDYPTAVDVAGKSVALYRYSAVLIGGVLAGLGGAYLTLAHANQFVENITSGRGFIALAIVVFARWSPIRVFFVSLLFGLFYALQLQLQADPNVHVPYQALQALPYLTTIVALMLARNRSDAPSMLGIPYWKG